MARGKIFHSQHLSLRVSKKETQKNNSPKISFVVSAKVARKAVDRNKLKRRGYIIVRALLKNIKQNYFFAFFFKKDSTTLLFEEIKKEIIFLLRRADVLYD